MNGHAFGCNSEAKFGSKTCAEWCGRTECPTSDPIKQHADEYFALILGLEIGEGCDYNGKAADTAHVMRSGFIAGFQKAAALLAADKAGAWKDGDTAKLVNDLRDVAVQFRDAQQLRERIAYIIRPLADRLAEDKAGGEFDTGDLAGKHGLMLETGWDEWPKSCDFTPVKRTAVEWFKQYYPALCLKSGLCEKVGGRLYTISTTHPQPQPSALPDDVVKDAEPAGPVYGIIDPDYARVYTQARIVAWQYGYACVMHGSFTRDLDLLLVPWTDQAGDNHDQLLRLIAQAAFLQFKDGQQDIIKSKIDWTKKPHGRKACSLYFRGFGDRRWVDISVIPCKADAAIDAAMLKEGRNA